MPRTPRGGLPKSLPGASEDVSEEGLQGVGVVGGGGHEGGLAVPGEGRGRWPKYSGGWSESGVTRASCHDGRPQSQGLGRRVSGLSRWIACGLNGTARIDIARNPRSAWQNWWSASVGVGGRHGSESVVDMRRNQQRTSSQRSVASAIGAQMSTAHSIMAGGHEIAFACPG